MNMPPIHRTANTSDKFGFIYTVQTAASFLLVQIPQEFEEWEPNIRVNEDQEDPTWWMKSEEEEIDEIE